MQPRKRKLVWFQMETFDDEEDWAAINAAMQAVQAPAGAFFARAEVTHHRIPVERHILRLSDALEGTHSSTSGPSSSHANK